MKDLIPKQEVALPNEFPLPASLSSDGASEELLSQNQNLMARLAIALRRSNELQKHIAQLEKKITFLKEQNHYISESSLANKEAFEAKSKELKHWKEKLKNLEQDYARIYSAYKNDNSALFKQIEDLKKDLAKYKNFRQRIQTKIRPFINSLYAKIGFIKENLKEKDIQIEKLIIDNRAQREDLSKDIKSLKEQLADQKTSYDERIYHLEAILEQELSRKSQLEYQLDQMKRKYNIMKSLDDDYTLAKNRAISLERNQQEQERKYEFEIRKLQKILADYKQENKGLKLDLERKNFVNESLSLDN